MVKNTHYTGTVPCSQFYVFVVTNNQGDCVGVFQNFGKAYQKISEVVNGVPLVEVYNNDESRYLASTVIKYSPVENLKNVFSIQTELFTYRFDEPLIEYKDIAKHTPAFSSLI